MTNGVEPRPPGGADKSLGEIVADVTAKMQLLVKEEIELAKAEVSAKAKKLGTGVGMAGAAGVTLLYFSFFLFFGMGYFLADLFNWDVWAGFFIVAGFFLLITIVLVLLGVRLIKRGSPPAPEMAIEEAKATKVALEEAID